MTFKKILPIVKLFIVVAVVIAGFKYCAQVDAVRRENRERREAARQEAALRRVERQAEREREKAMREEEKKAAANEVAEAVMLELIYSRAAALTLFCEQTGQKETTEELIGTPYSIRIVYNGEKSSDAIFVSKHLNDAARKAHHEAQELMKVAQSSGIYTPGQVMKYATPSIPADFETPFVSDLITITIYETPTC